jgi:hypothetical protein
MIHRLRANRVGRVTLLAINAGGLTSLLFGARRVNRHPVTRSRPKSPRVSQGSSNTHAPQICLLSSETEAKTEAKIGGVAPTEPSTVLNRPL